VAIESLRRGNDGYIDCKSVRSAVNPNTDPAKPRQSVYEIMTAQILAELEKGVSHSPILGYRVYQDLQLSIVSERASRFLAKCGYLARA
jgi:hypothetical protein